MLEIGTSIGLKPTLLEVAPHFERSTGHEVNFTFATAAPLKRRIDAGESFDIVILMPQLIDDLVAKGKIESGTQRVIGRSSIGVAIAKGAPKPDIGTKQALTDSLLKARAIAYSKEGQAGPMMARLIKSLGIGSQMGPKTILETRPAGVALNVVEGKADLAFTVLCEILPVPGVEAVGPLPDELNTYVYFAGGICAGVRHRHMASAFLDFLETPAARAALEANGIEPR